VRASQIRTVVVVPNLATAHSLFVFAKYLPLFKNFLGESFSLSTVFDRRILVFLRDVTSHLHYLVAILYIIRVGKGRVSLLSARFKQQNLMFVT
jgi:hypothetical protein